MQLEVVKNTTNISNLKEQQNKIEGKINDIEKKIDKLQYIIAGEIITLVVSVITVLIKTA